MKNKKRMVKAQRAASEAAYVVCCLASERPLFADNVHSACALCGVLVQHRPHVPAHLPRCCTRCYQKNAQPTDQHIVTKEALLDALLVLAGPATVN